MSVKCLCGKHIDITNINSHLMDNKHDLKAIKKRAPSIESLQNLMQRLDEVKEKRNEGDYLKRRNKLKIAYEYWKEELNFKRIWNSFIFQQSVYLIYTDHQQKIHYIKLNIK